MNQHKKYCILDARKVLNFYKMSNQRLEEGSKQIDFKTGKEILGSCYFKR